MLDAKLSQLFQMSVCQSTHTHTHTHTHSFKRGSLLTTVDLLRKVRILEGKEEGCPSVFGLPFTLSPVN
jgi:hypothetical protein